MIAAYSKTFLPINYVLVCGSYLRNRNNDRLCNLLGHELATHNIGMISGGGRPGVKVAESMARSLIALTQYAPYKIKTVFRLKGSKERISLPRIGSHEFIGNNVLELRHYLLSNVKALVVIGGATRTKEEVLLAEELRIPVIPISITKGTAFDTWLRYAQLRKYHTKQLFLQLNASSPHVVTDAAINFLAKVVSDD